MSKDMLSKGGDAVKALLSTMLGETAPLKFGTVQPVEPDDIRDDVEALLGVHSPTGAYAVLLDPGWLPLIAGLKLGVQTRVGDDDFEDIVRELAGIFVSAVTTHFSAHGKDMEVAPLSVKTPGDAMDEALLGSLNSRLPFFMEWEGVILHGFVLVGPVAEAADPETAAAPAGTVQARPASPAPAPASPQEEPIATKKAPVESPASRHASPETEPVQVRPAAFPELGTESIGEEGYSGLGLLAEVELEVTVELGRRRLPLADILRLTNGSVLELEKLVGEPLQIFANNRFIAEGEAVVIDEQFGVRITALASRGAEKLLR